MPLSGHHLSAKTDQPERLVIFLHGYGSNGADLIALAPYFAEIDPAADFLSPDAIEPSPFNPGGFQWFPIPFIDGSTEAEMKAGLVRAHSELNTYIDQQANLRGLNAKDVILIGFSQGTMMSLHTGLRRTDGLGGIIGFSGRLILPDLLKDEIKSRPPVMLIHGEADDVVPVTDSIDANQILRDNGIQSEIHLSPNVPHSIGSDGLDAALKFYARTQMQSKE